MWIFRNISGYTEGFHNFWNKQKSVWRYAFWYVKVFIYWKYIFKTLYIEIKNKCLKFPLEKINGKKKCPLFFLYIGWNTRFVSLKQCVGFSIFSSVLFSQKFIFLFNKMHGTFHFKRHISFQNWNNRKATHSFAPNLWFLSCNKKL